VNDVFCQFGNMGCQGYGPPTGELAEVFARFGERDDARGAPGFRDDTGDDGLIDKAEQ
jgi:hypothetical protein